MLRTGVNRYESLHAMRFRAASYCSANRAFTLVELLLTLAILVSIAAMVIPTFGVLLTDRRLFRANARAWNILFIRAVPVTIDTSMIPVTIRSIRKSGCSINSPDCIPIVRSSVESVIAIGIL